ncbi:MAG: acetylglutamate kinase [Spartobacteria bacterium]|nr:acetylglutamate kinase [Spartobacteria bacterium]
MNMQTLIEKAAVLVEAMPYFRKFQGETIVVKMGGSIMDDRDAIASILKDFAFMSCVGLHPVLVHGGGKAISGAMKDMGIQPRFVNGLRVTDEQVIQVVEHVLNHDINAEICSVLNSYECLARPIQGDTIISATKLISSDPGTGAQYDHGYVGEVASVDVEPIKAFLKAGITPVITPLGRGVEDKALYNINADSAAVALSAALQARKIVFLSDVPGLLADPEDKKSIISTVHTSQVQDLMERHVISGGMLPKIQGCVQAIRAGVKKVHIIDSTVPHSLLLELFTDKGVGTEIIP